MTNPPQTPAAEAPAGVIRTLRELPRSAVVLLFGIALNRAGSFVALFLILYLTGLGYSPGQAGLIVTGFGVGSIVGTFAGGSATGKYGARTVIIWAMLSSSLAIAALTLVTSLVLLLAVSFAAGAFGQMYRPAAMTMLADLTPPRRLVTTSAAGRFGLNLGAAVGPLLGVWLAAAFSYQVVFLVNALVDLLFAVVVLLVIPAATADRVSDHTTTGNRAAEAPAPEGTARYKDLLGDRRYLLFLAGMFITAVAEAQYHSTLPLEVQQRGYPTVLYGALVAINGALVILVELPLTPFVQRFPMRTTVATGCLLLGVGLSLFGLPFGPWIFVLGAVVWTLGEIISAPSIGAYPALAAPTPTIRSRYIGALSTCQAAGWAIGPTIGTALFEHVGGAVWVMCAALGLLAYLGMRAGVREPVLP
ncbi:MFS transporter [Microbispora cellulosiformans]|uniref:MFS transporter n=1 Tax=Microbispora cellulosiformans TaxID=2614688 RepID=A0A5J5JX32_9ACTN|nr:MFS transporter [Microbispora cellulosiformans]KAA9375942.1 MFS transporter [Microbispora cellulosiformans]